MNKELYMLLKKRILILVSCFGIYIHIQSQIPTNTFLPTTRFESSYPYITGDTVRSFCDHILDTTASFDPAHVKKGDTIFVMINFLDHFFDVYHHHITQPYILVTHHFFDESDDDVPGKLAPYLDDPKLIAWFTHNVDTKHPKLRLLPIGIGNAFYSYGHKPTFDQCIKECAHKTPKTGLLYMNFSIHTYPQERQQVYDFFKNKSFVTKAVSKPLADYLREVARYKFVLSPRGHGLDCFRTWEALLMGCYPVVKTSMLDPLFEDLPVVIVNDWAEVTQEFLEAKYQELSGKKYNMQKLYMKYWIDQIKNVKKSFKN